MDHSETPLSPPEQSWGWVENFKLDFTGGLGNFQNKWGGRGWGIPKITGGTLTWGGGRKITEGMQVIRNRVFWGAEWFWKSLNSLNCSGFFWYWKCN